MAGEMAQKNRRPQIYDQTQRELWARAAGRCEFRGCNKLLYKDELTQTRSNLAIISHIIGFSADGPRGDPVRSPQLAQDIKNLMLTCRAHGKIIDDKAREVEYPEHVLQEFKREHEQRIRLLTESKDDAQTHVLLVQASIGQRDVYINETDAFRAILPKYPAEERATLIDLSGLMLHPGHEDVFRWLADNITERTRPLLTRQGGQARIKSLSVFALAPVPLLIHLGHILGDIEHVDLYQRHRISQNWTWSTEEEAGEFYDVLQPDGCDNDDRPIALLLSVSDSIRHDYVTARLGDGTLIYEIRGKEPSQDFLRSRKRLELFGYEARKLLSMLRDTCGHDRPIHLFAAVPTPVAIEFGRNVKAFDSPFVVYEYQKVNRAYLPALTINDRPR